MRGGYRGYSGFVVVSQDAYRCAHGRFLLAYPILTSPGYRTRSIDERTLVYVADNPRHLIDAYVESGEGIDRAGGFAIQVRVWPPFAACANR